MAAMSTRSSGPTRPTKREERKQRAEANRAAQERLQRQRQWRSRALIVLGMLALFSVAWLVMRGGGEAEPGRVWSAEHGHWHDR
jgi:hypothetical protein